MKFIKKLGLAVFAALALTALVGAGSASATILTSPAGTSLGVGTEIKAESTHGLLTGAGGLIEITCEESKVAGKISNAGGASETVEGNIESLTFQKCKNGWVPTVIAKGKLIVHTEGANSNGNGTVTSHGAEVTVENSGLGIHCIYTTATTADIGTLTGSVNRVRATALIDINGNITREGGRSGAFCGAVGVWTGSYTVTTPDYLDVD